MTFEEFMFCAGQYWYEHRDQRAGQALFNTLHEVRPEIAAKIVNTDLDPFNDDARVNAFTKAVERMWNEDA